MNKIDKSELDTTIKTLKKILENLEEDIKNSITTRKNVCVQVKKYILIKELIHYYE